jgi:hypothetical protein
MLLTRTSVRKDVKWWRSALYVVTPHTSDSIVIVSVQLLSATCS